VILPIEVSAVVECRLVRAGGPCLDVTGGARYSPLTMATGRFVVAGG
jgi:hypothetical protein